MPGPRKVTVTEVGPRDGWQIEPDFIPTETKIRLIDELVDAGIRVIEFSSFVSPKAVPQLADAAEVLAGVDRSKGTRFAALVPNAKGAERAAAAGVDEMRVFVSASESHNQKNVNRSVEESLAGFEDVMRIAGDAGIPVEGAIATSFGCPFEGEVPVARVGEIARRFHERQKLPEEKVAGSEQEIEQDESNDDVDGQGGAAARRPDHREHRGHRLRPRTWPRGRRAHRAR